MKIAVGVSQRHVHLKKEDLEQLFGEGYSLKVLKELSQIGEFASTDKVDIKTSKGIIEGVRVLGPVRSYTQVEISKTDSFKLGVNPPIRQSGDIENSEAITIVGPLSSITINEGCIIASRHIHLPNSGDYGLKDNDTVSIKVLGEKGGILDNVKVKQGNYTFELHIDTDDANAFLIKNGDEVEIIEK